MRQLKALAESDDYAKQLGISDEFRIWLEGRYPGKPNWWVVEYSGRILELAEAFEAGKAARKP